MNNFICVGGWPMLRYLYIDTRDYIADSVFYKNEIPVHFGGEYVKDNEPYIWITCRIRKKYQKKFEKSFEELKNKMLLLGHTDYEEWCDKFMSQLEEAKDGKSET